MRPEIRSLIDSYGGMDPFLDWCQATQTDARSHFDITDEEWAALNAELDGGEPVPIVPDRPPASVPVPPTERSHGG